MRKPANQAHARGLHPAISYIRALYAPEDALLASIQARLAADKMEWQIGADEGKLLQLLICLREIKTIVEVGTLGGYSAIWMARALPAGGFLHSIDHDPKHAALAREFIAKSDVADKIRVHEGEGVKVLEQLSAQAPFDMIFIDADKLGYNAYLDWAEKNIRPGGLIVADNTLLFGSVYQDNPPAGIAPLTHASMRGFNERLADKSKYFSLLLPTEQGLSVAIKLS